MMGDVDQNDPEGRLAWSGIDRRRVTFNETVRASAGTHPAHSRGMVTEWRRPFATVLVGQSGLLQEGLARVLYNTDFDVIASATSVDELALIDLQRHPAVLLIVNAGDDAK